MAFFDSPKNRALWDKELDNLDLERARRKENGYKPGPERAGAMTGNGGSLNIRGANNPKVRRITLKELEEIERRAREAEKEKGGISGPAMKGKQAAERSRGVPERQAAKAAGR